MCKGIYEAFGAFNGVCKGSGTRRLEYHVHKHSKKSQLLRDSFQVSTLRMPLWFPTMSCVNSPSFSGLSTVSARDRPPPPEME